MNVYYFSTGDRKIIKQYNDDDDNNNMRTMIIILRTDYMPCHHHMLRNAFHSKTSNNDIGDSYDDHNINGNDYI